MPIENEDWWIVGGAAAGGVLLGALAGGLFPSAPAQPVHTGLSRGYRPKSSGMEPITAHVWAIPAEGYAVSFEKLVSGAPREAFPDMEERTFAAPMTAALFADDVMWQLDYEPASAWAPLVNQASEARRRERSPAVSGRRRRS